MPDKQPDLLVSIIILSDTVYEKKAGKFQFFEERLSKKIFLDYIFAVNFEENIPSY